MGRPLNDVGSSSQSPAESTGQPPAPPGAGGEDDSSSDDEPVIDITDPITYLNEIKETFLNDSEKYDMFLALMRDFRARRIDTLGVRERIQDLFMGHPNLLLGFNAFLPRGYEITVDDEQGETPDVETIEFQDAIAFVEKIKNRFGSENHVYLTFLDILNKYRDGNKSVGDVYFEIGTLFNDHPDLQSEFLKYIP